MKQEIPPLTSELWSKSVHKQAGTDRFIFPRSFRKFEVSGLTAFVNALPNASIAQYLLGNITRNEYEAKLAEADQEYKNRIWQEVSSQVTERYADFVS